MTTSNFSSDRINALCVRLVLRRIASLMMHIACALAIFTSYAHAQTTANHSDALQERRIAPATSTTQSAGEGADNSPKTTPNTTAHRIWQSQIQNESDWLHLAKPERGAEFSKFVIDVKTGKIYFVDAHVFKLHIDFVFDVLQKQERNHTTVTAYNRNYSSVKPQYILGYLTRYPQLNLWTFSFWEGDAITPRDVMRTYRLLQKSFYAPNLHYRPDSVRQEKMAKSLKAMTTANPTNKGTPKNRLPVITNDKIYQNLPFTAFQVGQSTGYLRIIPKDSLMDSLNFKTDDIVILQQAYPDISPVAGIITTQFSTPLAHVNLRASAWGIPNAGYKTAVQEFAAYRDQLVTYRVSEQGLELRLANPSETAQFEQQKAQKQQERNQITLAPADLTTTTLQPLGRIRAQNNRGADARTYGAKTANLGEIVSAKIAGVNVPDGYGIPFYYYQSHLKTHGLDARINQMLNDARFHSDDGPDIQWRREQLQALQQAIQAAPIQAEHLAVITAQWQKQLQGQGVFVRSSTNAEDLKGFNGAGLYDTVPNVKTPEALHAAIKKVWASLWNERAVNERTHAGITHTSAYPAVLIQKGVNATAAGVLLTTDIWGHNPDTYTINAKWGLGIRVVEGQKIPEQILYDTRNYGTRIISRSGETTMLVFDPKNGVREVTTPAGDTILTEARARKLGETVQKITPLFTTDTALDVEWVLEGETFWVVQARPYVVKSGTSATPK